MIYIVIALMAEASPIIKNLKLTKSSDKPFKVFSSNEYKLIITGIGKEKATIATSHLLTLFSPTQNDYLFNIGICGAPKKFEIGEALIINKISTHSKYYYPDMLLRHDFRENSLLTVDKPQENKCDECVDMEASAIYSTSLHFLKSSQMAFIKIVSDHFSSEIPKKEDVSFWIETHVESIKKLFENASKMRNKKPLLSLNLQERSQHISDILRLSHTQKLQFNDALIFYVLSKGHEPKLQLSKVQENKLQRNKHFEQIIASLK